IMTEMQACSFLPRMAFHQSMSWIPKLIPGHSLLSAGPYTCNIFSGILPIFHGIQELIMHIHGFGHRFPERLMSGLAFMTGRGHLVGVEDPSLKRGSGIKPTPGSG